jgi:glycosyltransferase involved in cell wall biosynthesis
MLLTIIIPHYNLPRPLLERCLESVKKQQFDASELEVLIVDDGSENPPLWVTEKYPEMQLICAQHGGLGSVRNLGMSKATGEYLLFLDSDDFLEPDSIRKCFDIIHHSHPDILRFNWKLTDGTTGQRDSQPITYPSGAHYMAQNNLSAMACVYLFRSDLIKKHGIEFQSDVYHEDEEFTTRLHYYAGTLIDSNIFVYHYYVRPDSITQNIDEHKQEKRLRDIQSILLRIKSFRDETYATATHIQRQAINRKLTFLAVDTILNTIYLGKSWKDLHHQCLTTLKGLGLYPLPHHYYSLKYLLFRVVSNNNLGLRLLYLLLRKKRSS